MCKIWILSAFISSFGYMTWCKVAWLFLMCLWICLVNVFTLKFFISTLSFICILVFPSRISYAHPKIGLKYVDGNTTNIRAAAAVWPGSRFMESIICLTSDRSVVGTSKSRDTPSFRSTSVLENCSTLIGQNMTDHSWLLYLQLYCPVIPDEGGACWKHKHGLLRCSYLMNVKPQMFLVRLVTGRDAAGLNTTTSASVQH